jgi:circadian clock protein KaiB
MPHRAKFKFRLYVAGDALNACQARQNLSEICETHLHGRCTVEVIDVFLQPERALVDSVFMTPTLVILSPPPVRRIVGTLSQEQTVLRSLGLEHVAA